MEVKELLGEELYNQVSAKIGDKKLIIDDGAMIPAFRFKEVNDEKKALKDQIAKHESDMKALKDAAAGNESLSAQIAMLQKENKAAKEQYEAGLIRSQKSLAVLEGLLNAGVVDPAARELLAKTFDVDAIVLEADGKPKGFESLIKPLKENKTFAGMFGEVKITGQEHKDGANPTPAGKLEQLLVEAQKRGNLAEVISIKRQMHEAAQSQT